MMKHRQLKLQMKQQVLNDLHKLTSIESRVLGVLQQSKGSNEANRNADAESSEYGRDEEIQTGAGHHFRRQAQNISGEVQRDPDVAVSAAGFGERRRKRRRIGEYELRSERGHGCS